MILDKSKPSTNMKAVESACSEASAGPKKDRALQYLIAAVEARKEMRESEKNKELDAAKRALALTPNAARSPPDVGPLVED